MTSTDSDSDSDRDRGAVWFLWRLARHRPGIFAIHTATVTTLAYTVPFLPALVVRALFDRLGGDTAAGFNIATLLAVYVAIGLGRGAVELVGPFITTTMMQSVYALLRRNMLEHVLRRPGARALPSSPGEALVRFQSDPESVARALDFSADPIGQVFAFVFAGVVLGRTNLFLTVAVVVPSLAVLAIVNLATPKIRAARLERQKTHGEVSGLLGDAFAAVASVKAAGAEHHVTRRVEGLGDRRRHAALRDLLVDQLLGSVADHMATVATGVILLLAGSAARAGRFTAGDFAVFTSYLAWLGEVVRYTGTTLTGVRQTEVSVGRMRELLPGAGDEALVDTRSVHLRGEPPPLARQPERLPADRLVRLDVRGLTYVYDDAGRGVRDLGLRVARGEFVVITGRVGAGKTTALRATLGLLPAQAGEVRWNDALIRDPSTFFVPPRCAYTAQVPRLFSIPIKENVLLGVETDDGGLALAAHLAVLERDLPALEGGWDTRVGPRGLKLSGGQVQRVAAARMLVRRPELLVVDDVSSALDVETEALLWERLRRTRSTCLVASHRRDALRRADRIYLLKEGRLVDEGSLAQLLKSSAEMRDIWAAEPPE